MLPVGASRKDITRIKNKAHTYSENFSIIGLTRVFSGNPLERVFWFCILVVAISIGVYMSSELMTKYIKKDVRVDKQTVITDSNHFPTVTICLKPPRKKTHCNRAIVDNPSQDADMQKPCPESYDSTERNETLQSTVGKDHITIGDFKITCQERGICESFSDLMDKYFKVETSFEECLIWNYDGTFFNDENRFDIDISIINKNKEIFDHLKDDIRIYVSQKSVYLALQHNYLTTSTFQHFQLSFKKTVIKRLPAPYTSKCVEDSSVNIFPGDYSLEHCMASKRCVKALKKCGDTYDFCKNFLPFDLVDSYHDPDKSILEVHRCLHSSYYQERKVTDCELPCKETSYDIYGSSYHFKENVNKTNFKLSMKFENPYIYKLENEEVLYSWSDFLGGLGGNIGLFCGFSLLFLVEIAAFIILRCWAKVAKKNLVRRERIIERQSRSEFPADEVELREVPIEEGDVFDGDKDAGDVSDDDVSDDETPQYDKNPDEITGERLYYSQTLI